MGFGVWGLGFGVWGLGFGVWGLGFGVLKFGVWFVLLASPKNTHFVYTYTHVRIHLFDTNTDEEPYTHSPITET